MISPTGKGVRVWDRFGSGYFGTGRGSRTHAGTDFLCTPGQPVVAPYDALVVRESRPYADGQYSGLLLDDGRLAVKIWYVEPRPDIVGRWVECGEPIGRAQNIADRYGDGMQAHIHLQVERIDPMLLMD